MKSFFLVSAFALLATTANAAPEEAPLINKVATPKDTELLYNLEATLVKVEQVGDNSLATMAFTLSGCADKLGPVYVTASPGRRLLLSVNALGIGRLASKAVKCVIAPVRTIKVNVGDVGNYESAEAISATGFSVENRR